MSLSVESLFGNITIYFSIDRMLRVLKSVAACTMLSPLYAPLPFLHILSHWHQALEFYNSDFVDTYIALLIELLITLTILDLMGVLISSCKQIEICSHSLVSSCGYVADFEAPEAYSI